MRLHDEPEWNFPLDWMNIGDSFFIPTLKPSSVIFAVDEGAKRAKIKVKAFQTIKDNCLGVRVWRIR